MKKFTDIAYKYIKIQKKRSISIIIGIMLSIALITAGGIISATSNYSDYKTIEKFSGNYHCFIRNLDNEHIKYLKNNLLKGKVGFFANVGYEKVKKSKVKLIYMAMDKDAIDLTSVKLKKGKIPQKEDEIAIQESGLKYLGNKVNLGDSLNLTIQSNDFKEKYKKTFKLVGILKNPDNVIDYELYAQAILNVNEVKKIIPQKYIQINSFLQVKYGLPIASTIEKIRKQTGIKKGNVELNKELIKAINELNKPNYPAIFIAIFVCLISIAVIYNTFYISVIERMKLFGTLRTIGTSPVQLKKIVLKEGVIYGVLGITFGVLLGIISSKFIIANFTMINTRVDVVISKSAIIVAVVSGIITILVSVLKPASMASKVSPIDALKGNENFIKIKDIKIKKWHDLIYKTFGVTGKVAYQNMWRNKKRTLISIFSLSIGVILFIVVNYYASNLDVNNALEGMVNGDYSIKGGINYATTGYTDRDINKIKELNGVKEIKKIQFAPVDMLKNKHIIYSGVYGYNDLYINSCKKYLISGNSDLSKLKNGNYALVKSEGFKNVKVGDVIKVNYKKRSLKLKIIGIIDKYPNYMGFTYDGPDFIVHENFFKKNIHKYYNKLDINVAKNINEEVIVKTIKGMAKKVGDGEFVSKKAEVETFENQKAQLEVLAFTIIFIIAFIAIFNMVNTNFANIIARKREIAMLRSIGMTNEQMKKTIGFEGAFCGVLSSFWGVSIGVILCFVLYILSHEDMQYLKWKMDVLPILVVVLINILIGFISTMIPLKKFLGDNIVENLRSID